MSRFIETIRLLDGKFGNLIFHQLRMHRSIQEFYGADLSIDLKEVISSCPVPSYGLYKVKLVYDKRVQEVLVSPYSIKKVKKLKIVYDDSISYSHKFQVRDELNNLFEQRGNCDDIIIARNKFLTDASYANLVFGMSGKWFTPTTYLLNGTMRQQLLAEKIIHEKEITVHDLHRYEKVKLVNAMLQFDGPEIDVSQIVS